MLKKLIGKMIILTIGAFLVALGLDCFLVCNKIIDGGIIGISIILSYLKDWPLGALIVSLNIPFFLFGYQKLGRKFLLSSLYAIFCLGAFVTLLASCHKITGNLLLACVFGGLLVGAGVGLIIRNNGSLDGTEVIAISIAKKIGFSVGEIVMFFNVFILTAAGFVFDWDHAMYSILAYFVIFKTIDVVLEGFDDSKAMLIVSDKPDEIAAIIMHELGRGVTFLHGQGAYSGIDRKIIYCIINRLEISKIRDVVVEHDSNAFITIENVHEVQGGVIGKKLF
ncbi:MAG: YitT family protein [bacterium]